MGNGLKDHDYKKIAAKLDAIKSPDDPTKYDITWCREAVEQTRALFRELGKRPPTVAQMPDFLEKIVDGTIARLAEEVMAAANKKSRYKV